MFHTPSTLRRPLAAAGAAIVGLAATVALSSPASAHHPLVTGTPSCVDGAWQVDWKVTNSEQDLDGDLTGVTFTPAFASETVTVGATLPKAGAALTTTQPLDLGVTEATLAVSAHWIRDGKDIDARGTATVSVPRGGCKTAKPAVAFNPDCAGQVSVVVSNGAEATKALRYDIVAANLEEAVASGTVQVGESSEPVVVPPDAGEITVRSGRTEIGSYTWTEPKGGCVPALEIASSCDDLTITVANPPNGLDFDLAFTPSTGSARTVKIEKGESATVTFPASEGLTVTLSVGDEDLRTVTWEKPSGCDSGGATLPTTGPEAGVIAGSAGALLALGGALFFVARRRRLRFTA